MIFLSLLLATILRIYKIWTNFYFSGELGQELLNVRHYIDTGSLALVGPKTSHEWLNFGPIYYWILEIAVKIFGSSPYILFWISLTASLIGIYLLYWVFTKIEGRNFALILSLFVSVSPLWVWAARLSKLHDFFFIFVPLVIYCLYKIWLKDKKYIIWLGLTLGMMFSFHYSHLPLFGVVFLVFLLRRKLLKIKDYLLFLISLVLPNITIFIYDAKSGFEMTRNFILWIPYRIAGFFGVYPKNNVDIQTGTNTISAFNEFFGRNLFWDSRFWILGSIVFLILFIAFVIQNRKKMTKDFFVFYLISSTCIQFLSLIIHTNPPLHYFYPVFMNFGLLFSYFAVKYWSKMSTKVLTILIFILMFVTGIFGLNTEHANDIDYIPLATQERVADGIVKDAAGKPFALVRIGPYDYFPEMYDQNYQLLILQRGGKIDPKAKLKYIIYDIGQVYVQKSE